MTPKEKAQNLFERFIGEGVSYGKSKYCAMIAVDEILNLPELIEVDAFIEHQIETFYREVKREIDNL